MAYKIVSWKDVYDDEGRCTNSIKIPEVDVSTTPEHEHFYLWIAHIDGREYGKVMDDVDMPTQDSEIDYREEDLSADAELKAQLNELSVDNNTARTHRSMEYPTISDQVGAMMNYFKQLKADGTTIPAEIDALLTQIDAAKTANPKDGDLE